MIDNIAIIILFFNISSLTLFTEYTSKPFEKYADIIINDMPAIRIKKAT